jgi:flavin reductase (DIM6/NTAB) family NADH-FMN oxidoreductase RutF
VSSSEIDAAQFRQLLGRFATGVTVLTVVTPDGRPMGMTATSLASVSLRPPLVSVCVDHEAELHDVILKSREFVVNVLASQQETLARRFSDKQLSPESRGADPARRRPGAHHLRAVG